MIRCPVSHKGLNVVAGDALDRINTAIAAGNVLNQDGKAIETTLSEALITDDGKRVYPVNDGIPVLLEAESIGMEQLD